MNSLLLNRDGFQVPADGWYQVAPLGEFAHAQAGVVQVVDAEACAAMANRFAEEAGREPFDKLRADRFAGLLVDFDHFSLDGEKRSEAAGWITALENRDGGLFAQIRWSDVGEEAVKGGRYRFLSPVWSRADCVDLGNGRVRPVRLLNAAVTNDPNLKGMQPLSNRCEGSGFGVQGENIQQPTVNSQHPNEIANAGGGARFKWVLGETAEGEHCPTCTAAAGQVHTMAEWVAAKVVPGGGALYCQEKCRCRLKATTDASVGALGGVPVRREEAVENSRTVGRSGGEAEKASTAKDAKGREGDALANVGWTEQARLASLAVRRAKAAVRGGNGAVAARQQVSMERDSQDAVASFEKKGLQGMTVSERKRLLARIAGRTKDGAGLTPSEKRFLGETAKADVDKALAEHRKRVADVHAKNGKMK